jgi:hypothetical protein
VTSFEQASLVSAAGVDPWGLVKKLNAGDPAQIESLAAAFYRAGGDLTDAHTATAQAQSYVKQGYQVQGSSPLDFDRNAAQTKAAIKGGAENLPKIAKILGSVAQDLAGATTQARAEVDTLDGQLTKIVGEWNTFWQGIGHHLPEEDWLPVRNSYLDQAVQAVKTHGGTVNGYVTTYESSLATALRSMADLGYLPPDPVEEGPGDVNLDSAQAKKDAALILAGEGTEPPGRAGIDKITRGSEAAALLVAKAKAGSKLSPEESAYLNTLYDTIGAKGLAALPAYVNAAAADYPRSGPGGTNLGTQETLRAKVLTPLADGIMVLSDPTKNADGHGQVPQAVRDLENTKIGYTDPDTGIVWAKKIGPGSMQGRYDNGLSVDGLSTYQGFADLMNSADTTGGTSFTQSLGESAIRVKQQLNAVAASEMHLVADPPGMIMVGDRNHPMSPDQLAQLIRGATGDGSVNELLNVVSHNGDASASLLLNTHDREAILGMNWDTAQQGAAAIVHSGTDRNVPAGQQDEHARAALAVMSELGSDRGAYEAHVTKGVDGAVLDMANQYIDTFQQPVDPNNPGSGVNDHLLDAFGNQHVSVVLSDADRARFLEYLMHGDGNAVKFHAAADAYSQDQLARAFGTGDHDIVQKVLTQSGALDGAITRADYHDQLDLVTDKDNAAAAAYQAAQHRAQGLQFWEGLASNGVGLVIDGATGGAASPIVSLATPVVDHIFAQATDPGDAPVAQLPRSEAQLNDANDAAFAFNRNYLIEAAAHQAGLPVGPSLLDRNGNLLPSNQLGAHGHTDQVTQLASDVADLERNHGADRASYDDQYHALVTGQYWDDRGPVGNADSAGWRTADSARHLLYGDSGWSKIPGSMMEHDFPDDPSKIYATKRW